MCIHMYILGETLWASRCTSRATFDRKIVAYSAMLHSVAMYVQCVLIYAYSRAHCDIRTCKIATHSALDCKIATYGALCCMMYL